LGAGTAVVIPEIKPLPKPYPVKLEPRLLTSGEELKPPYPSSKLITEEEASLTLRLTIDERGRVVAVEPVGRADPVFLAAARRHLLARWRYKPASEDGRAIASTAVITLRFQLDG
jgi:protein TonB